MADTDNERNRGIDRFHSQRLNVAVKMFPFMVRSIVWCNKVIRWCVALMKPIMAANGEGGDGGCCWRSDQKRVFVLFMYLIEKGRENKRSVQINCASTINGGPCADVWRVSNRIDRIVVKWDKGQLSTSKTYAKDICFSNNPYSIPIDGNERRKDSIKNGKKVWSDHWQSLHN